MIEGLRKYPAGTVAGISVYYLVGIIGLAMDRSRFVFQILVPFTLLFSLFFLWLFDEQPGRRVYLGSLVIMIAGFLVEVLGVNTGLIFGNYTYGETLGIKLWNTPLVIGVNWLLLIYSCRALVAMFTGNRWLRYLAGGALMVIYDIALEPVAIALDMWNWFGEPVPMQNFIGWFLVSIILFIIFDLISKPLKNKIAPAMFIIQFLFFVILNIIFKYT